MTKMGAGGETKDYTNWRTPTVNCDVGPFTVSVGFDDAGDPFQVFFTARGRSGTGLEDHLYEMGVTISKIMQKEELG